MESMVSYKSLKVSIRQAMYVHIAILQLYGYVLIIYFELFSISRCHRLMHMSVEV